MSRKYIVEKNNFDAHVGNKSNPHGVTATQIGAARMIDINDPTDFNTLYVAGTTIIYNVRAGNSPNAPDVNFGILVASDCGTKKQIFFTDITHNAYCRSNNSEWEKFVTNADLENYLPLSGGDITGWINSISEGTRRGTFLSGNDCALLRAWCYSQNDGRDIAIYNPDYSNLADSLRVWETGNSYRVFGEHNTALLASTIQNLMQTGELSMLDDTTKVTLTSIEETIQQNYAEAQHEGADVITLELLERGVI